MYNFFYNIPLFNFNLYPRYLIMIWIKKYVTINAIKSIIFSLYIGNMNIAVPIIQSIWSNGIKLFPGSIPICLFIELSIASPNIVPIPKRNPINIQPCIE